MGERKDLDFKQMFELSLSTWHGVQDLMMVAGAAWGGHLAPVSRLSWDEMNWSANSNPLKYSQSWTWLAWQSSVSAFPRDYNYNFLWNLTQPGAC